MTKQANALYQAKYGQAAQAMPKITLWFLQASRSIRIAWALEELGLPYEVKFADRQNQKAPQEFKEASGNPLGKFPTLTDGDLNVHESGAIVQYLCDKYDEAQKIIPKNPYTRARTLTLVHAAEGTLMLHGLAILYARWNFPAEVKESNPQALDKMEEALSANVQKDLDWLSLELERSTGFFLVGNEVTAADIMMHFSASFIIERELGTRGKKWPKIEEWLKRCESTDTFKRAVEKTGHTLYPATI